MADVAEAKKQLAEEREERAKAMREAEQRSGTPTPTQEENDLAALGHHVDKQDDGSGPEVALIPTLRQVQATPAAGGYQTRQATPVAPKPAPPKTT
jgi:hypothetical protein